MRKTLLSSIFILIITAASTLAQNFLDNPESVVYDEIRNRYLVSSWNSGDLIAIDSLGNQSLVLDNADCTAGLCIVNDIVYAAAKENGVVGYDLETGEQVLNKSFPATLLLNDVTADSSGNLYLSDPQAHLIIRVDPADTADWSYFVDFDIYVPNGMVFDSDNDRLILVSARDDSPVQAISLVDSSVTTLLTTTIDIMDGIAQDRYGNYYISCWGTSNVYRFDEEFSGNIEFVSHHALQPADIYYNPANDTLAVPLFYSNAVDFVHLMFVGIDGFEPLAGEEHLPDFCLLTSYPNPFNSSVNISLLLFEPSRIKVVLFDMRGSYVATIREGFLNAGNHEFTWNADRLASGCYMAIAEVDDRQVSQKIALIK